MTYVRVLFKSIIFVSAIIVYFAVSILVYILSGLSFNRARPILTKVIVATSVIGLKVYGVKVTANFFEKLHSKNYLIVSNHLSYLDVLIISSFFPSCFVTSVEMKETPFLGQMCLFGGCLFVERRSRGGLSGEVAELTNAIKAGLNVAIFPEAKSTNGEELLRFKRPLFQAAMNSQSKVLPVCINYKTLDGRPIVKGNRDNVFWYGHQTPFLNHALRLFTYKKIEVELVVLKSLDAKDFQDKNELSDKCFQMISESYQPIT